jgi:hypothetical protein
VSKPRKPYGPNPPGRLVATMIKVLAAEMSDSGRLGRGKRYWNEDAVIDLVIGHGVVTAEVQGSRPHPYVVTIGAAPGNGVPARRSVRVQCTCPDDDGFDAACKHAVAALFALSDEVAIDPTVLDRWRGNAGVLDRATDDDAQDDDDEIDLDADRSGWASVTRLQPRPVRPWERTGSRDREDRHDVHGLDAADFDADDDDGDDDGDGPAEMRGTRLNRVVPLRRRPSDAAAARDDESASGTDALRSREPRSVSDRAPTHVDPSVAQVASMLVSPSGEGPPSFPPVHPVEHPPLADRMVHEVLVSALDEFDVNWS